MECKHELEKLVGTADGIVCSGCGKVFQSLEEVQEKPEPKKGAKRGKKVDADKGE